MLKKIIPLCALLIVLSANCYSESFSFSNSKTGMLNPGGYYYYYVYQYVYHYNGSVLSESHSFVFSGALSEDNHPKLQGLSGNWLIYEGTKHYIAIPCTSGECIYVLNKTAGVIPCPLRGKSWQKISDPIK